MAAVILFAAPAFAAECRTGQFTPTSLAAHCADSDPQGETRCDKFKADFTEACKSILVESGVTEHRLKDLVRTPQQEADYRKALTRATEANAAVKDAEKVFNSADSKAYANAPAFQRVLATPFSGGNSFSQDLESSVTMEVLDILLKEPPPNAPAAPINEEMRGAVLRVAQRGEQALVDTPTPDPAKVARVAELYLTAGDTKDAGRLARRLIETAPADSRGSSLLAEAALAEDRPADAERWAQKALALNPQDKKARDALSFARSELSARKLKKPMVGSFQEARAQDLAQGIADGGLPPRPLGSSADAAAKGAEPSRRVLAGLLRRGFEKMNLGDLPGALEDVSVHLDSHPDDEPARLVRAEILIKLGKPGPALSDIETVLVKSPDDPRALRAKAAALYEIGGRDPEALATIERALAIEPSSGIGHLTRAKILERLGRIPEAITEYRTAAQLDPALEPIVEAALRRLGAAAPAASKGVEKGLLRGGFLVVSLGLILLGLVGGAVVVTRRARTAELAASARERTLKAGDLVAGQYRITRELGRGGMGVVFEAVDEKLKRSVALKQLQGEFRASVDEAARFLQEARLVAQLRHPNVAEIYAAVEDGGLYLVFELVRGRSLDAVLGAGVSPEQARGIVAHACAALTAAHARRIVHRDLKPSNMMISDSGELKVMDFGIAHQSMNGGAFTQTSASGTPPYMAPEQAMGSVSPSSDLYALAVMAYELLAGVRPFPGPDFLGPKIRGEYAPVTSRRTGLPARLDGFFASALSPDPARRPADAAAFAAAFAACWS